jgi:diguanylate cyclase (GGDEF)-like protein/PAS domain S-box-containing protein
LSTVLAACAFWAFAYALEIGSPTLSGKFTWMQVSIAPIILIPLLWLIFTFEFSGQIKWLQPVRLAVLGLVSTGLAVFCWTDAWRHLVWKAVALDATGTLLMITPGPIYWVMLIYCYSLVLAGSVLLLQSLRQNAEWYLRQVFSLILALVIPWIGSLIYVFNIGPVPGLDLTPETFFFSGLLIVISLFRYSLFDLIPVARSAVVDHMGDGVIILDGIERIIDINNTALKIFGIQDTRVLGLKFPDAVVKYPVLAEIYGTLNPKRGEISIKFGEAQRWFDVRIDPLLDFSSHFKGWSIILHETTDRRNAEQELETSHAMLLATFEATADGILVVNGQGKIVRFNRKFSEMWRLPEDVIRSDQDEEKMNVILDQLSNPAMFFHLMNSLASQPEAESFDVLELKDGRVFERYSRPQRIGDRRIGRVWSFHDITEQRRSEERLRYLSTHDILTSLYNRVFFEEEINRLENSRQYPISLIIADVDGLKLVNDHNGHQAGDQLLRRAATILKHSCRTEDMVARIGGDEFGIILTRSDEDVAAGAMERIQNMIDVQRSKDGESILSLSVGAATAKNGESLRRVQRLADKRMYQDKRQRRQRRHPEGTP